MRRTQLQIAYDNYLKQSNQIYVDLLAELKTTVIDKGTLSSGVDKAFSNVGYTTRVEGATLSTIMASASSAMANGVALDPELAKNYFLFTDFKGTGSLSSKLHSSRAKDLIEDALKDNFKYRTSVLDTLNKIGRTGAIPVAKLPKALRDAEAAVKGLGLTDPNTVEAIAKAKQYVASLTGGTGTGSNQLKAAYKKSIKALEKGSKAGIDKALEEAVDKKIRYMNSRIARTESARAYDMSFNRSQYGNDAVIGYRVLLSSGHKIPDICNVYAEADLYGMGAGVYPKGEGAEIPFHPNCVCDKEHIIGLQGEVAGKYSSKRADTYLKGLPDKKREQIIGVGASNSKDLKGGLAAKGFTIQKKGAMIPKEITTTKPKKVVTPPPPPKVKVPTIPKAPVKAPKSTIEAPKAQPPTQLPPTTVKEPIEPMFVGKEVSTLRLTREYGYNGAYKLTEAQKKLEQTLLDMGYNAKQAASKAASKRVGISTPLEAKSIDKKLRAEALKTMEDLHKEYPFQLNSIGTISKRAGGVYQSGTRALGIDVSYLKNKPATQILKQVDNYFNPVAVKARIEMLERNIEHLKKSTDSAKPIQATIRAREIAELEYKLVDNKNYLKYNNMDIVGQSAKTIQEQLNSTVTHEIGHAISDQNGTRELWAAKIKDGWEGRALSVSKYAGSAIEEYWAEAFTAYKTGYKARIHPQDLEVVEYILNNIKR